MQRASDGTSLFLRRVGWAPRLQTGRCPLLNRARIKVRVAAIASVPTPGAVHTLTPSVTADACRACGAKLTVRKRVYCDACFPQQMAAQQRAVQPKFVAAGPAKLKAMQAGGHDPTATPEAQHRRASSASKQRKAVTAWRDDGSLGGLDFDRDIFPSLKSLPVRVLAEAIGTTISHSSKVRPGTLKPHERHWEALKMLISAEATAGKLDVQKR